MLDNALEAPEAFTLPELRGRRNAKWQRYPGDVLACWVAEMDFRVAAPIQAAMQRLVRDQEYGYPLRDGDRAELAVSRAFVRRMRQRFGWQVDADDVFTCTDLVQATFASVLAYSEPGDQVVLQTPAYPPFRDAILDTGRRLLADPLRDDGTRYVLDLDRLSATIDARTRMLLFCHPHNPTGRVFARDELEALGRLAIERDLVIVSDEIHADLVYPGRQHIPMAAIGPEVAARTITLTSATKSFNIPGLRCGVMHFGSPVLKARFEARVPRKLLGQPSIAGIDATVAAWDEGQPWLDAALVRLKARSEQLVEALHRELPSVRLHAPEATYLAWIDCAALSLGMPAGQFFLEKAGVAASAGESFDASCGDFLRLNFATSPAILDEIVARMARAVRANSSRGT
ncbi:MAG: PatB family C-S lyase [Acetobacteraceae bacterium]